MENYKYCELCGTKYYKKPSVRGKRWLNSKYCSLACQRHSIGGWNKGKTGYLSEEARQKMADNARSNIAKETPEQRKDRIAKTMESRNANGIWKPATLGKKGALRVGVWQGDNATYNGKHRWIQNNWQKTGVCEECGKKPRPFGNRRYGTEWANLDGNYDRNNKETWKELCVKCHRKQDRK